jgi:hypothetical protein
MTEFKLAYVPRPQFYDFHTRKQRWAVNVCHRRASTSRRRFRWRAQTIPSSVALAWPLGGLRWRWRAFPRQGRFPLSARLGPLAGRPDVPVLIARRNPPPLRLAMRPSTAMVPRSPRFAATVSRTICLATRSNACLLWVLRSNSCAPILRTSNSVSWNMRVKTTRIDKRCIASQGEDASRGKAISALRSSSLRKPD